ncbi:MAG: hypothetical protein JWN76_3700 [Chitinophagaceae bacterium]|nr:hypothetical protein [Chitinophagaceae bacterium]
MKAPVSVVIITNNAARTIEKVLQSAKQLTDDIILVDSGSTDATLLLSQVYQPTIISTSWEGYGRNKNLGNRSAKYDWILSLDSDEVPDVQLINQIKKIDFSDSKKNYEIKILNYVGSKPVRFGEWKNDKVTRLFNKQITHWNDAPVHEQLVSSIPVTAIKLKGFIHHYTTPDIASFRLKQERYAGMMADKYFAAGKKAGFLKLFLSPLFSFIKNYIFLAGWMDGRTGLNIALANSYYTYNKYRLLKKKWRAAGKNK